MRSFLTKLPLLSNRRDNEQQSLSFTESSRDIGTAESTMSAMSGISDTSILSQVTNHCKIHCSMLKSEGIYEIDYTGDISTGIILRNNVQHKFPDNEDHYVIDIQGIVEGLNEESKAHSQILNQIVEEGDVLIMVNDISIINSNISIGNSDIDIYEVANMLAEIKERNDCRKLTFLKPRLCSLEEFLSQSEDNSMADSLADEEIRSRASNTPSVIDDDNKTPSLLFGNIIDRSRPNTQRSALSTERKNLSYNNTQLQNAIIEEEEFEDEEMEVIPSDLSPQHKRDWMDLIDLRNCDRPKDRLKFWKQRRREFQRAPLPILRPISKPSADANEESVSEIPEKKMKKEEVPLGDKFKKLMREMKWYEKQYLLPESPNVSISMTRSDAARDYIEEKMQRIRFKTKKRQIKKQIAKKLEILGKDKETDIILSLVEHQEAMKIPSRTKFITTTKGEVKVAKIPPAPSMQMERALKAQEDAKRLCELERADEDARIENERLDKRSNALVERLIGHIVELDFEECIEDLCENIAEIKFDNFCRKIADSALMNIAMEEIAVYTNSSDCIAFYEDCLITKENNMCEKAADLIFKAVFDVELYMQSKELFKRMADVQICEKAADRFMKEKIKREIEFDRQEMLKRTEFFANQSVNTILTNNLDHILTELICIEIDDYLLIKNDIDARNKYELEMIEECINVSFDHILHDEINKANIELAEFQKELEFEALLRKNDKIVDIIMDNIFSQEIEDATTKLDDNKYDDLDDFLELQESAATSRKIERRLMRIIDRVFSAVCVDCLDMELIDLIDYGISQCL